jgi:hypothetical protein
MKKLIFITLLSLLAVCGWGQNYVRLGDASGYEYNTYQNHELAATALINSLPEAFRDSIKVFDFGYYTYNSIMIGTNQHDSLWETVITQISSISKYYIAFGRLEDSNQKSINKFKLNLPTQILSNCIAQIRFEIIENKYSLLYRNLSQNESIGKQVEILNNMIQYFYDLNSGNCCPLTDEEIVKMLFKSEFQPIAALNTIQDTISYSNYDYGKIKIDNQNLIQIMETKLSNLPNNKKFIITDNRNICFDNNFDTAKNIYENDLNDFDVWIHVFTSNINQPSIIFMRFEQNIDFGSILDENSLLNLENSNKYKNIYYHDNLMTPNLNNINFNRNEEDISEEDHDGIPCPFYIVQNNGETFSSITTLYEYEFFVSDLQRWNPNLNGENLQKGTKLNLFIEECEFEKINPINYFTIPYDPTLSVYNFALSNSEIKNEMKSLGYDSDDISHYLILPSKVNYVPIPDEVLKNLPTFEEAIKTPQNKPSLNTKWGKLLNYGSNTLKVIGSGVSVLAIIVFSPTPAGQPYLDPYISKMYETVKPGVILTGNHIESSRLRRYLIYVTYTKFKSDFSYPADSKITKSGKVYIGRSRGTNKSPCEIVKDRNNGHTILNGENYNAAKLDQWGIATTSHEKRHNDPVYGTIRGRENTVISALGGSETDVGKLKTRSRNKIYGIYIHNPRKAYWENLSKVCLPLPYKEWDGATDICP